ncbi:MAG: hypothetical protein R3325_07875 [Thermoanaerobaculia bacterium]|nr:hypothetical protein [Thermoanaerobaculia bacterium]
MSLKAFHLFFIAASTLMCVVVGAWGVSKYRHVGSLDALGLAVACFVLGLGLLLYGVRAYRKLTELGR